MDEHFLRTKDGVLKASFPTRTLEVITARACGGWEMYTPKGGKRQRRFVFHDDGCYTLGPLTMFLFKGDYMHD